MQSDQSARPKLNAKKSGGLAKLLTLGLVGVFIFALGINVGSGRINIGPDSLYRKSVQKNTPENLDYTSVEAVYDQLRGQFDGQLDQTKLMDGIKEGLAQATGDPYTEYFNTKDAKAFNDELNGTFSGIGAELGKDQNNNIIVISPIADFPAAKAGLMSKDVIIQVDGQSTAGQGVGEVVNKIRGQEGTEVTLKVVRNNAAELTFKITRAQIKIPSVKSEILPGNIGYLQITRFGNDTVVLSKQAAENFKAANVKGVILDLRQDPGGLLDAAVAVSSLWLPAGKTVLSEKRDGVVVRSYTASGNPILNGVKTVVMIDEGSASASEITAGALKDNGAATLIGVKSFGKGSVQQLAQLTDGGVLKVTIAHWFTPSGKGIDKTGIEPDQKVERTVDDIKAGKDPQKDAAINFLNK